MPGLTYDQCNIGDHIVHSIHRTVTETDNLLITTLTHNPQPLHLDAEYAGATDFGRIVVNGTFTFGLMVGLSVGDTTSARWWRISAMTRLSCPILFSSATRCAPKPG